MKILSLRNIYEKDYILGYVLYYEKSKTFYIELNDKINPVKLPIVLDLHYMRKQLSINSYYSYLWLKDRVIPENRQNIGSILKEAKLKEYDLFKLLMLNNGRCTNDEFELVEVNKLPNNILKRFEYKVSDVIPIKDNKVLCFFANGICKKIDIGKLKKDDRLFSRLLANPEEFNNVTTLPGGYGIGFQNNLNIEDYTLYEKGKTVDIEYEDFLSFVDHNIIDTHSACEILDCSRQNIDDLVKRNKLKPIKQGEKNKLFLLKDINNRNDF